jgi:LAO/AO transport system kinase
MTVQDVNSLIKDILAGDSVAVARAISLVENGSPLAQEVMQGVFPHAGQAVVVGVTGAPGTGKSTLVNQMIAPLHSEKREIGIVAVDPSSPFTGGAILGDRIRMMRHSTDPGVFIRSMATRGHMGGLARTSGEALMILEAAGKDFLLIETVGVGQDEVEVVKLADVIVVVLIPGAGDEIQVFKAGIMEIADVFVLNKADSPDAERAERQLNALLDLGKKEGKAPALVRTVATDGEGVDRLLEEVNRILDEEGEETWIRRKKQRLSWMLKEIISTKIYDDVVGKIEDFEFGKYVEKLYRKETDPYTLADKIVQQQTYLFHSKG